VLSKVVVDCVDAYLVSYLDRRKLLEKGSSPEKLWRIDKHIVAAIAGLNADAMILVNFARYDKVRLYLSTRIKRSSG
jgi:20S proteasome alpha/beta subunit